MHEEKAVIFLIFKKQKRNIRVKEVATNVQHLMEKINSNVSVI